uniref:NDH-dependent cyclic electron flow 5 n=1 Tax=Habenaria pantlingiana TaxID=1498489 RepID=A0A0F7CYY4_9ASPA
MATRSFPALPSFIAPRKTTSPHAFFNLQKQSKNSPSLQAWPGISIPSSSIDVEYLGREFGGRGATFEALGDDCVVTMGPVEGSTANLMLPRGLITSYKPRMWHGGRVEVVHSLVSEDENGEVMVHGGVSTDVRCVADSGLTEWSPATWALHDVRGSSDEFIQVELISTSPNGKMEAKYLVTLREDMISSELVLTNSTKSIIQLRGSIMSHLTVSTPDASYAVGLQGSNYCNKQAPSEFRILPPADSKKHENSSEFIRSVAQKGFDSLFSAWGTQKHYGEEKDEEQEREESSDYAQMNDKFSRVYTFIPVEFTVIDRGRRNSVVIQRSGFEELYMFSPGSDHDWYGKYAFVCVGPCALLKPILLGPGGIWKGAQYLYNPNI